MQTTLRLDARPPPLHAQGPRLTPSKIRKGETWPFFADLDPPQTFALRADEILENERQTVCGDLGERCKRSQRLQLDLACGPRCNQAARAGEGISAPSSA